MRAGWKKLFYDGIISRANGHNLNPPEMQPRRISSPGDYARAETQAEFQTDKKKLEYLESERDKFLEAQEAERKRQAQLKMQVDLTPDPARSPAQQSLGRYNALRAEGRHTDEGKKPATMDADAIEKIRQQREARRREEQDRGQQRGDRSRGRE